MDRLHKYLNIISSQKYAFVPGDFVLRGVYKQQINAQLCNSEQD